VSPRARRWLRIDHAPSRGWSIAAGSTLRRRIP
jgi:hypothetical protein